MISLKRRKTCLLRMYTPILGPPPQLRSLVDQDARRVRLLKEEQAQYQPTEAHNAGEILCPSPTKIAHINEATDKRSFNESEHRHLEQLDRLAYLSWGR